MEKENTDLAGKLEDFVKKVNEIVDFLRVENETLQEENKALIKILEENRVVFDVLLEQGYLGLLPKNSNEIRAV